MPSIWWPLQKTWGLFKSHSNEEKACNYFTGFFYELWFTVKKWFLMMVGLINEMEANYYWSFYYSFLGSFIYMVFRTKSLVMFRWFEKWKLTNSIDQLRLGIDSNGLPHFILYALPDGLWMFSYMSTILYLWNNWIRPENYLWVFGLPLVALFSEFGQYFGFVLGTFDVADIIMYLLGIFLPLLIYKIQITNFKSIKT